MHHTPSAIGKVSSYFTVRHRFSSVVRQLDLAKDQRIHQICVGNNLTYDIYASLLTNNVSGFVTNQSFAYSTVIMTDEVQDAGSTFHDIKLYWIRRIQPVGIVHGPSRSGEKRALPDAFYMRPALLCAFLIS